MEDCIACFFGNADDKKKVSKNIREGFKNEREARKQARYGMGLGKYDPKVREMNRKADKKQRPLEKFKDDIDTARKSRIGRKMKEKKRKAYKKERNKGRPKGRPKMTFRL